MGWMKRTVIGDIFLAIVSALVLVSCSTSLPSNAPAETGDRKYDSEFPHERTSPYLERIAESVKMLSSIAYYRTYTFEEPQRVRRADITPERLDAKQDKFTYVNKSLSGTATIISYSARRIALLTCAHVVAFSDTIVEYYVGPNRRPTEYIKSLSIKERQTNYAGQLPEGGELEVLALDRSSDIAVVGKRFEQDPGIPPPVFPFPVGRSKDLEWGTFLYLYGYPSGHRIVTRGIVSNPNKDKRGTFLVDAVFGGGFSGGIAVALRDGVPHFELVGMMKIASARTSYILVPPRDDPSAEYDPALPYTGEIYVERHTDIEYGVTQAIPAEALIDFFSANRERLRAKGYDISLARAPE
jgi:hypothetical protein